METVPPSLEAWEIDIFSKVSQVCRCDLGYMEIVCPHAYIGYYK